MDLPVSYRPSIQGTVEGETIEIRIATINYHYRADYPKPMRLPTKLITILSTSSPSAVNANKSAMYDKGKFHFVNMMENK